MIKDNIILHIPHSSVNIPHKDGYINNIYKKEIELLTDHATDKIFDIQNVTQLVCPWSRVFCDVERFIDNEPMETVGMGFFYTHTDDGQLMRIDKNDAKLRTRTYYDAYHKLFTRCVDKKLEKYGSVLIIDCHSFTNFPFNRDLDQNFTRPDICIGTDEYHTPVELSEKFFNFFNKRKYFTKINEPYSGSIVPIKYYKNNKNVQSIMIEINRDLYMHQNSVLVKKSISHLNKVISDLLDS